MACPVCAIVVGENENSIECEKCLLWIHYDCSKISKADYARLIEDPKIEWICKACTILAGSTINNSTTIGKSKDHSDVVSIKTAASKGRRSAQRSITNADLMKELTYLRQAHDSVLKTLQERICQLEQNVVDLKANLAAKSELNDSSTSKSFIERSYGHQRRNDIIVSGLPKLNSVSDMLSFVISLAAVYDLQLSHCDFSNCRYISNSAIIVTFVHTWKRDNLMAEYFKRISDRKFQLKLTNVDGSKIQNRVFLNNNLSPELAKLHKYARALVSKKLITSFGIKNYQLNIIALDGVLHTYDEAVQLMIDYPSASIGGTSGVRSYANKQSTRISHSGRLKSNQNDKSMGNHSNKVSVNVTATKSSSGSESIISGTSCADVGATGSSLHHHNR